MAKPRTFVSSTCLDLKDARAALESHLSGLGHEPLLSDTLTFGVTPSKHSHQACLDQVDNADYFILVIGGRRGGTYIGSERSITNEEYRRAMKRQIPIMIFVSEEVDTAAKVYRKNPKADLSDMVDDLRIFDFVDLVRSEARDNWVRLYKNVEDIKRAITAQMAYICLLYSQQTRRPIGGKAEESGVVRPLPKALKIPEHEDPASAAAQISGLKAVHATISRIQQGQASGKDEKLKLMWIFARYGVIAGRRTRVFSMNLDRFKQYAWGASKSRRVFNQLSDFGVGAELDDEPDGDGDYNVRFWFREDEHGEKAEALKYFVKALLKRHADDDALELFKRADMTVFT